MVGCTSQFSRIAQSPPATDLRGGKASEALSTVWRNILAAEDVVRPQSGLSGCRDELEWSNPSLPTPAGRSSLPLPIFDSFSLAFFRNPEKVRRKLMLSQDRCG